MGFRIAFMCRVNPYNNLIRIPMPQPKYWVLNEMLMK